MPPTAGEGAPGAGAGSGSESDGRALPADTRAMLREFFELNSVADKDRKIFHQNAKLRHKNAELRAALDRAEATKPKDGAVILPKEDAAEFEAFKKLNLKTADVTAALAERDSLKAKDVERTTEQLYAEAAEELGYENVPLFTRMLKREGLHLEFQDVREKDDEGKTVVVRMPMVRSAKDDTAKLEPLPEYLEREVPEIIPVLQSEPAGSDDDEGDDEASAERTSRAPARRSAATRSSDRSSEREAHTGVAIPLTRNARPSTGAARDAKHQQEAVARKRAAGGYGM